MKTIASVALLGLLVGSVGFAPKETQFTVKKTFSDRKIRRIENQIAREYGVPVVLRVLSRNQRNEITNLTFMRLDKKSGKPGGGCSSDNFGLLVVVPNGCSIADAGHEGKVDAK